MFTSRVHFFLWLLTQNKILTRNNVSKIKTIEDSRCLFCNKRESAVHLFFECVVSKQMWLHISDVVEISCGTDFGSIGKLWLSKRNVIANMFTSAALWGLWKLRNYICFQNGQGRDVQTMLQRIAGLIHN